MEEMERRNEESDPIDVTDEDDGEVNVLLIVDFRSECWVSLCLRRSTLRWNARPQMSHANGLNPVCLRECVIKLDDCENALPQTEHLCGFSPVGEQETELMSELFE